MPNITGLTVGFTDSERSAATEQFARTAALVGLRPTIDARLRHRRPPI
jgi:hypothetical protein